MKKTLIFAVVIISILFLFFLFPLNKGKVGSDSPIDECRKSPFCVTDDEIKEIELSYYGVDCLEGKIGYFKTDAQTIPLYQVYNTYVSHDGRMIPAILLLNSTNVQCMSDDEVCPPDTCVRVETSFG